MRLLRFFALQDATTAERRATLWVGLMFFATLASTFLLRPLRDQFGVQEGVERLPYLYGLTLAATTLAVPPFWWLANRMPSRRFVPLVLHTCAAGIVVLAFCLSVIGDYRWNRMPWLGEAFWGGFSALNVVLPAVVWIHAVEHFDRRAAQRLFGLIAVGGTAGAYAGSKLAHTLVAHAAPPWRGAVLAAVLLQLALLAFHRSGRHCRLLRDHRVGSHPGNNADRDARPAPGDRVATGGLLAGLSVLRRDRQARCIALYMVLLGMLATAFYSAQTELVGQELKTGREQHAYLANLEEWSQGLVLLLQLFCTGRLMARLPAVWLLVSLPVVSIAGLGVFWLAPTAFAIFCVQVVRRGAAYAFEKPAREVLYTPLDLETQHKVKFLLDTFAFRLGDLLGAYMQAAMRRHELSIGAIVSVTIVVALLWIGVAIVLQRPQRSPTP